MALKVSNVSSITLGVRPRWSLLKSKDLKVSIAALKLACKHLFNAHIIHTFTGMHFDSNSVAGTPGMLRSHPSSADSHLCSQTEPLRTSVSSLVLFEITPKIFYLLTLILSENTLLDF